MTHGSRDPAGRDFGLLIAGGVFVVGTVRQARRDQNDMNAAFADARGEAHDPVFGPAPWSSFDMEALGEEEDAIPVDRSDPYATLTGVASVSWSHSKEANGADDIPPMDDEPTTHLTAEPDQTFVAEPDETSWPSRKRRSSPSRRRPSSPSRTRPSSSEPYEKFVAEPDQTFVPSRTRSSSPSRRRPSSPSRLRCSPSRSTTPPRRHRSTTSGRSCGAPRAVAGHHPRGRAACTRRRPRRDDHARGRDAIGRARGGPRPRAQRIRNAGRSTAGVRPSTSTGATGPRRTCPPLRSVGRTARRTTARHRGGAGPRVRGATTDRSRSLGGRGRTDRASVARFPSRSAQPTPSRRPSLAKISRVAVDRFSV